MVSESNRYVLTPLTVVRVAQTFRFTEPAPCETLFRGKRTGLSKTTLATLVVLLEGGDSVSEESEDTEAQEGDGKSKGGLVGKLIVWGIIFAMGAGAGFAVPVLTGSTPPEKTEVDIGVKRMDFPEPTDEIAFIEFDEVVANINDELQSRYVTCSVTLQVSKSQLEALTTLVEEKKTLLKNWLLAHLRDKTLEEIRGKYGHNLLRREIHGQFNEILFTDGIERIQDILFRDLKTQ